MKLSNILFRRLAFRLGLLLIVGAVTVTARAEWDHQLRFSGRTYPRGASFDWKSGFTQVLWDRRASSEQDWNYGFVRPVVDIQTIGLASLLGAEVEVFPVSIFGFAVGADSSFLNIQTVPQFDCQSIRCRNQIDRRYFKLQGAIGYGPWALVGGARWDQITTQSQGPFYDDSSTLIGTGSDDRLVSGWAVLAYQRSESQTFGLYFSEQLMTSAGNANAALYTFGQVKRELWKYTVSVGAYRSTHQAEGLSASVQIAREMDLF